MSNTSSNSNSSGSNGSNSDTRSEAGFDLIGLTTGEIPFGKLSISISTIDTIFHVSS